MAVAVVSTYISIRISQFLIKLTWWTTSSSIDKGKGKNIMRCGDALQRDHFGDKRVEFSPEEPLERTISA